MALSQSVNHSTGQNEIPLTFVFNILLSIFSNDQPSIWGHFKAMLNLRGLFQLWIGG